MYETHGTECQFVHKRLLGAVGGFISGGPGGAIAGFARGGGGGQPECRGNQRLMNGRCVSMTSPGLELGLSGRGGGFGAPRPGPVAAVQRFLPGGATGRFDAGEAVMGQWGAALEPEVVGSVQRMDGSTGPLLRCIRGMVLGTDSLCYNKPLANNKRKWPRATRPFLSGGDVKCLRRSNTLRKSKGSKKLLRELGFK